MPKLNKLPKKISILITVVAALVILTIWYLVITVFLNNSKTQEGNKAGMNNKTVEKPYEIAYQGDKNDKSGRTVLAKGQRADGLLEDKFYWQIVTNKELKLIGYSHGVGIFKRWEGIKGSKDRFLTLDNPDSKTEKTKELHIRVIFEPKIANSLASTFKTTQLSIENLDYGFKTKEVIPVVPLDYFNKLSQKTIDTLIKYGDVITVYPVFLDIETAKKENSLMQKDENGYFIAQTVLIRRFGGKETILSELGK